MKILNWKTRVTDLLGIQYPIVQGGLAHLAYAELVKGCFECRGPRAGNSDVVG